MADKVLSRLSGMSGALAVGAFTVNSCLYNVDGGERAVLFDNLRGGIRPDVFAEGTHPFIPVVQRPIILDIRTRPREIPSITGTKDLQTVNIKLRVLWRPIVEKLPQLYRELGSDYDERVLPSIVNEVLKSIVAQYNAEELLSKREEVSRRIKSELMKRAVNFYLTLDDVAITHLTFGREFTRAIEQKQVAFQEAERQQWVVKKAEQERIAVVTRAEGEAEAANIITKAMEETGNAIIEVRRIDAAKEIAGKLANSRNITYLPGGATSLRADELDALTKALAILTEKVEELSAVNKRALLLQKPGATAHVAFVQRAMHHNSNRRLSFARRHAALQPPSTVQKVLAMFQDDGSRLKSPVLASLAMHIAADPFGKVKKMIQDLVERLLAESTAEATKKGFCDTELGKAEKDRDFRLADVKKINAELASLLAKEDALEEEMDELSSSMVEARGSLNESGVLRESEKDANLKTLADAKEGLAAVTQALEILKAFYKEAAKAKVFLQASPVDEDTTGPGFDAAYTGKQEASKGIVGLLEVIKSDFERTISKTEAAEKEAAADFVKLDRSSKVDIGGKETKTALDGEDLATTKNSITQSMADLKSNMDLLDSALKEIEALKPACIDMTMPYEERVQKRDEEIASLKSALCILDTDGVEEGCTKGR